MELLALLIFLLFGLFQIAVSIYAFIVKNDIEKRFDFPLSSMVEASETLENYVKIYRKLNLKVDAKVKMPAVALSEFVLINKDLIYRTDLFTNFFTLFQLELTRKEYEFSRSIHVFQNILFFLQLIFFGLYFAVTAEFNEFFIYASVVVQILLTIITLFGFFKLEQILNRSLSIAIDLMDLDDVEYARAEALKDDLKYNVFEYPIDFVLRLLRFFVPV